MIVLKNNQNIYYAVFSNNFDLESLKGWLIFYRKFDQDIKAYRAEGDDFLEIDLLEDESDSAGEKTSKKK